MARVTGAEVKEIIDTVLTADECTPFITAANLIINDRLTSSGFSSAYLKEIERWYSAHLVYIRDPQLKSEKIGDGKDDFNVPSTGKNLEGTPYGQQVLLLDTTGSMANLGKRAAKLETIWDSSSSN